MGFRRLVDMCDKDIKDTLGDYYFISKDKMENLLIVVEGGAKRIKELTKIVEEQQQEIERLTMSLMEEPPNAK